ncbi:unnamed protein product [Trichogramma brassicae]|uniref:Endonuclease/exonuclease/phosphatase domain-containing protein n=1 Tax=Trichogramma brassicae TaxID=86971 RepID=A0A6H5I4U4_9HYME|nr:unnamed protein product [Trichogramma brassicae]
MFIHTQHSSSVNSSSSSSRGGCNLAYQHISKKRKLECDISQPFNQQSNLNSISDHGIESHQRLSCSRNATIYSNLKNNVVQKHSPNQQVLIRASTIKCLDGHHRCSQKVSILSRLSQENADEFNFERRITPGEALNHAFVTLAHLVDYAHCNNVKASVQMMEVCRRAGDFLSGSNHHQSQPVPQPAPSTSIVANFVPTTNGNAVTLTFNNQVQRLVRDHRSSQSGYDHLEPMLKVSETHIPDQRLIGTAVSKRVDCKHDFLHPPTAHSRDHAKWAVVGAAHQYRQGSSIVDLTFICETLTPRVKSWTVSGWYTHSDHQAIVFEIEDTGTSTRPSTRQSCRWNARTLDADRFSAAVSSASVAPGTAEDMASSLMSVITSACDASMSRVNPRHRREPVYWWTAEIADLRRSCLRARRLSQRSPGRQDEETHSANYASARHLLRVAIKTSKRRCWRQLCDEVNSDVWGKPYKIAMSRLRCPQTKQPSSPLLVRSAVVALFPRVPSGGAYTGRHLGRTQRSSVEDQGALRARPGWHTQLSAQNRYFRTTRHLPAGVHDVSGDRRFSIWLEVPEACPASKVRHNPVPNTLGIASNQDNPLVASQFMHHPQQLSPVIAAASGTACSRILPNIAASSTGSGSISCTMRSPQVSVLTSGTQHLSQALYQEYPHSMRQRNHAVGSSLYIAAQTNNSTQPQLHNYRGFTTRHNPVPNTLGIASNQDNPLVASQFMHHPQQLSPVIAAASGTACSRILPNIAASSTGSGSISCTMRSPQVSVLTSGTQHLSQALYQEYPHSMRQRNHAVGSSLYIAAQTNNSTQPQLHNYRGFTTRHNPVPNTLGIASNQDNPLVASQFMHHPQQLSPVIAAASGTACSRILPNIAASSTGSGSISCTMRSPQVSVLTSGTQHLSQALYQEYPHSMRQRNHAVGSSLYIAAQTNNSTQPQLHNYRGFTTSSPPLTVYDTNRTLPPPAHHSSARPLLSSHATHPLPAHIQPSNVYGLNPISPVKHQYQPGLWFTE